MYARFVVMYARISSIISGTVGSASFARAIKAFL